MLFFFQILLSTPPYSRPFPYRTQISIFVRKTPRPGQETLRPWSFLERTIVHIHTRSARKLCFSIFSQLLSNLPFPSPMHHHNRFSIFLNDSRMLSNIHFTTLKLAEDSHCHDGMSATWGSSHLTGYPFLFPDTAWVHHLSQDQFNITHIFSIFSKNSKHPV